MAGRLNLRAVAEREKPRYRLLQPFYCDDMYFAVDEEIIFEGTPNEGMEPLNRAAEDKLDAWYASLPSRPRPLADVVADSVANRPRDEAPKDVRQVVRASEASATPVMGKGTSKQTVELVEKPAERKYKGPKKVMGTVVKETPSPGSI